MSSLYHAYKIIFSIIRLIYLQDEISLSVISTSFLDIL